MTRLAIICDFDDTAAAQNVAHILLARFAGGRDRQYRDAYLAGRMPFREYQERAFDETEATIDEMASYARGNAALRPGFAESVEAASAANMPFTVVSLGLAFYVRALTENHRRSTVPVIAVGVKETAFAQHRFSYDYPEGLAGCETNTDMCKCQAIRSAKIAGFKVVFAGDSHISDACAAVKVDVVFARAKLLDHCRANGIKATPFEDLHPLASFISSEARSGTHRKP